MLRDESHNVFMAISRNHIFVLCDDCEYGVDAARNGELFRHPDKAGKSSRLQNIDRAVMLQTDALREIEEDRVVAR